LQQINEQEAAQTTGRLTSIAEKLLMSRGGYLADRLYLFERENNELSLQAEAQQKNSKLHWLILAREHYFETSKEYPIANKKDLAQALRFEDNIAPFKGVTLKHIQRLDEQTHKVTFWVINPKVLFGLPSQPWLIIPESFLLAKSFLEKQNIAEIARLTTPIYVAIVGHDITSGIQSIHTPDLEAFAIATGSAFEQQSNISFIESDKATKIESDVKSNYSTLLYQGIKSTNIVEFKNFILPPKVIDWKRYPWKKASILSVGVLSLYLALTSGWLVFKEYRVEQQMTMQADKVNEALALQKHYREQQEWQQQLSQPFDDLKPYWNTWQVFLNIIATGAEIKSVQYKKGEITLRGKAKKEAKATDILVKLNALDYIESPKFISPVRNFRGQEEFAISFGFSKQVAKQSPNQVNSEVNSKDNNQTTAQEADNAASK
jgi:hypothetical protein